MQFLWRVTQLHAAPATYPWSQHHCALVSPAQTSKLALGTWQRQAERYLSSLWAKKTRTSKMDARQPWGLGCPLEEIEAKYQAQAGEAAPEASAAGQDLACSPRSAERLEPCRPTPGLKLPSRARWFHGAAPPAPSPSLGLPPAHRIARAGPIRPAHDWSVPKSAGTTTGCHAVSAQSSGGLRSCCLPPSGGQPSD